MKTEVGNPPKPRKEKEQRHSSHYDEIRRRLRKLMKKCVSTPQVNAFLPINLIELCKAELAVFLIDQDPLPGLRKLNELVFSLQKMTTLYYLDAKLGMPSRIYHGKRAGQNRAFFVFNK
jgi:hypothetical protein